jgi:CheY-like chemotaxis protein
MTEVNKKILIVDDDKFLRDMYVTKFSSSDFTVQSAGSAKEAIEQIKGGFAPDILIFDIVMPTDSGWDLMDLIKSEELIPSAKKIVLSNQGEESDKEKSKEYNVDGYIVKAFSTPSEVVAQVKEISEK